MSNFYVFDFYVGLPDCSYTFKNINHHLHIHIHLTTLHFIEKNQNDRLASIRDFDIPWL
jgi:hypothetical protein